MRLEKSELLEKLSLISSRYKDVAAVKRKMDNYEPDDVYERQVVLPDFPNVEGGEKNQQILIDEVEHDSPEAGTSVQQVYERIFPIPNEPYIREFKEGVKEDWPVRGAFYAVLACAFFVLAGFCCFRAEEVPAAKFVMFGIAAICAAVVVALTKGYSLIFEKQENERRSAIEEENNRAKEKYEQELCEYRQKEQAFFDEYWDWRTAYLAFLEEEGCIRIQLELDRNEAVEEIEANEYAPLKEKLDEVNDLVGEEYLPVIDTLISYIQSGRADNVKEAINLYEEVLYKERQLQFEREKEEQRRLEESLRLEAEERRHEEEMRLREEELELLEEEMDFLEEQEYQRQAAEERRYREEAERRKKQEEKERIERFWEKQAIQKQCCSCANLSKCYTKFQCSNCARYRHI